jgi:hypothetical protein
MFKKIVTAAFLATSAVAAFASSGYGPAPHYNPIEGAPASQRGVSAQTIGTESAQAYGGMSDTTSQSGGRVTQTSGPGSLFAHH